MGEFSTLTVITTMACRLATAPRRFQIAACSITPGDGCFKSQRIISKAATFPGFRNSGPDTARALLTSAVRIVSKNFHIITGATTYDDFWYPDIYAYNATTWPAYLKAGAVLYRALGDSDKAAQCDQESKQPQMMLSGRCGTASSLPMGQTGTAANDGMILCSADNLPANLCHVTLAWETSCPWMWCAPPSWPNSKRVSLIPQATTPRRSG